MLQQYVRHTKIGLKHRKVNNTNESHTTWLYNIENLHSNEDIQLEIRNRYFKGDFWKVLEKPEKVRKWILEVYYKKSLLWDFIFKEEKYAD